MLIYREYVGNASLDPAKTIGQGRKMSTLLPHLFLLDSNETK